MIMRTLLVVVLLLVAVVGVWGDGSSDRVVYTDTDTEVLASLPPARVVSDAAQVVVGDVKPKAVELDPAAWEFSILQTTPGTGGAASYLFARLGGSMYAAWADAGLVFRENAMDLLVGVSTNLPVSREFKFRAGFGAVINLGDGGGVEGRVYGRVPITINF
jgi:hypothetical protein